MSELQIRYQYQTWKGTRKAESRLTDELSPMRNHARGGDILIFQRHARLLDYYKLTLVRQSSPDFSGFLRPFHRDAGEPWATFLP